MPSVSRIRAAHPGDAGSIARIHVESWQWAYRGLLPDSLLDGLVATLERRTEIQERRLIERGLEQRTWVTELDRAIVGFADTGPSRDPDATPRTAEIYAIYL